MKHDLGGGDRGAGGILEATHPDLPASDAHREPDADGARGSGPPHAHQRASTQRMLEPEPRPGVADGAPAIGAGVRTLRRRKRHLGPKVRRHPQPRERAASRRAVRRGGHAQVASTEPRAAKGAHADRPAAARRCLRNGKLESLRREAQPDGAAPRLLHVEPNRPFPRNAGGDLSQIERRRRAPTRQGERHPVGEESGGVVERRVVEREGETGG
jgi:hypothetical protein